MALCVSVPRWAVVERFWTRAAVKGVLVRDSRVLLLRRRADSDIWPGLWDLPGGAVDKEDRTLEAALIREFREETGLDVRVGPLLQVSLQWVPVKGEPSFPSISSCFRCSARTLRQLHVDPAEHSELTWAARGDLKALAVVPYQRPAVQRALAARA